MLRLLVLLLVLFNALYYAWSHRMLAPYGYAPMQQSEPERLSQQIRPDALTILSPEQARQIDAAARTADRVALCLQAGPFDEAQAAALRQALPAVLPAANWALDEVVEPARWIVYMGKYADAQTLARKRAELVLLDLRTEPLTNPELAYGLSLGGYLSEAGAQAELAALVRRGVRTAQVVQERAQTRASQLRIAPLDDATRARLDELRPVLAGRSLQPCN